MEETARTIQSLDHSGGSALFHAGFLQQGSSALPVYFAIETRTVIVVLTHLIKAAVMVSPSAKIPAYFIAVAFFRHLHRDSIRESLGKGHKSCSMRRTRARKTGEYSLDG